MSAPQPVALFYLADPRLGGWPTFTAHLWRVLALAGYAPQMLRLGARTESRSRTWTNGLAYLNVSMAGALSLAESMPAVLVAVGPRYVAPALQLLERGAALVLHDPTELHAPLMDGVRRLGAPVVVIRTALRAVLAAMNVAAEHVPHPYVPVQSDGAVERRWNAVAYSRIDWDKNTLLIAQANVLLPPAQRCRIYGTENRLYTHHRINAACPHWRADYYGAFTAYRAGVELARSARHAVDLTVIKGDGGGTQYTFLEAWNGGAQLVVHRDWLLDSDDTLRAGVNCSAVSTPEQLAELLRCEPDPEVVAGGQKALATLGDPRRFMESWRAAARWQ